MSSRDVAREGSTTTTGSAHASLMDIIKVKPIQVVPRESKDSHARTSTSMDIFVGKSHAAGRFTTHVYGGQLVGQALMAAATTVMDTERTLHSMHCHFLQAGSHNEPFVFTVDRLRDGATYSSRFVVARQAGAAIFTAMCSFQQLHEYSDTNALQHQSTMPANVPPPESLPDQRETLLDAIRNARLSEEDKIRLKDSVDSLPPFPVDIRVVQPIQRIGPDSVKPREPRQLAWIRLPSTPGCDAQVAEATVKASLAYASDWGFLETAALPHGINLANRRLKMSSLDHTLYFHHKPRAGEWLLFEMESGSASGGRALATGRIYRRDGGQLVATVVQEGLMRIQRNQSKL
ncbi:acyl-CoA thioesterase [Pycnococcus provasolii]